jgi:hypothetical protein
MLRITTVLALGLILTACGGGIDSYEEGLEAQAALMREMIGVLEDVTDETSAKKAAGKIESLGSRMGDIALQISELPQPDAKEMQEIARQQRAAMQEFQQDTMEQMMKLAQYPVLQEAWMNAVSTTR